MRLSRICKKARYIHIYPSNYDLCVQIVLPKHVWVHRWDGNVELNFLQYVSHLLHDILHMKIENISRYK